MKFYKKILAIATIVAFSFNLFGLTTAHAATVVSLGTADDFAVLAGSTITNIGSSVVTGDLGLSPGSAVTGFPPGNIIGVQHIADATAVLAKSNANTAYNNLDGQTPDTLTSSELGGTTKNPGIYRSADGTFKITGTLTLDGLGDSNAVFIFKTNTTLITAGASNINLINGAQACNVFWEVGSSATLGTYSTFRGNILAVTSITITTGANVYGRMLARDGSVTIDSSVVSKAVCGIAPPPPVPATLHVIKQVINDSTGTANATDFNLHVLSGGSDVAGSPAPGTSTPGSIYSLSAGDYKISEDANGLYTSIFSGDCDASGKITLTSGSDKTCTVTNYDVAPIISSRRHEGTINIVKTVINDNGGNKTIADFSLFVNGEKVISGATNIFPSIATRYTITETNDANYVQSFSGDCDTNGQFNLLPGDNKICIITNDDIGSVPVVAPVPPLIDVIKVPSPLALPNGPGRVDYTYTLRNIGAVAVTDITMVGDSCSPLTLASGDLNNNTQLDLDETWIYKCSTILTETHTNIIVATGWANGLSATDIANATVIVGDTVVPPLIHLTKIPSTLTLPATGGMVTYTESITNPGTVALHNIQLSDDKCAPMKYISGDVNRDALLDTDETWTYTCRSMLTKTTMNTAVATGQANGITVRDFAIATVVVTERSTDVLGDKITATTTIPNFPKTGIAPKNGYMINIPAISIAILLLGSALFTILKQRKKLFQYFK